MRRKLTLEQLAVRDAEWYVKPADERWAIIQAESRKADKRRSRKTLLLCLLMVAIAIIISVCSYDPNLICRPNGYDGQYCIDGRTGQEV